MLLSHVAYANKLFGLPPVLPVYWSLSLEFQYYLLIGVLLVFELLPFYFVFVTSFKSTLAPNRNKSGSSHASATRL